MVFISFHIRFLAFSAPANMNADGFEIEQLYALKINLRIRALALSFPSVPQLLSKNKHCFAPSSTSYEFSTSYHFSASNSNEAHGGTVGGSGGNSSSE